MPRHALVLLLLLLMTWLLLIVFCGLVGAATAAAADARGFEHVRAAAKRNERPVRNPSSCTIFSCGFYTLSISSFLSWSCFALERTKKTGKPTDEALALPRPLVAAR